MGGDARAAIFLLKACAGWRESGPVLAAAAQETAEMAEKKRALVAEVMEFMERKRRDG